MQDGALPTTALALILTHNAPQMLRTCVANVLKQLRPGDRLAIIDNASEPPAAETIASMGLSGRVEVLRLASNLGPAGGYAHGLRRFLQTHHEFVWLVDDDMLAGPGALSNLRRAALLEPDPVIVFPGLAHCGNRPLNLPAWCGVLIRRTIVQDVGLPREEYFWWAEDTEYLQWRIPKAGYRTVWAKDATVTHLAIRRGRTKPAWKFYYETRNVVFYRVNVQMRAGVSVWRCSRKLLWTFVRTLGVIVLREDHKALKLEAVRLGILDGIAGRLGIRYEVPAGVPAAPPDLKRTA
jgi:GT2 family glycosyltransferase